MALEGGLNGIVLDEQANILLGRRYVASLVREESVCSGDEDIKITGTVGYSQTARPKIQSVMDSLYQLCLPPLLNYHVPSGGLEELGTCGIQRCCGKPFAVRICRGCILTC